MIYAENVAAIVELWPFVNGSVSNECHFPDDLVSGCNLIRLSCCPGSWLCKETTAANTRQSSAK